ncbi:uncharacterized protein LOC119180000 isoform X2 [Rhipicephalus microplus]|uniref:uncharacterized protein LOC119180000 isoform X2 n=1 Tax=Rhipicephalus microplus TaxID=6941 RepID=UPI003F6C7C4C
MLLLILLLCCQTRPILASCPDNEEPATCSIGAFFPQLYCGNAFTDKKWMCHKKNRDRCVCTPPLFRTEDGKCVTEKECSGRIHLNKATHEKQPPERTQTPSHNIADHSQKAHPDAAKLLKFIQNEKPIYLVMAIRNEMPGVLRDYHVCLKSAFITRTSYGAYRTLSNYKFVQLISNRILMATKQGAGEFIVVPYLGPDRLEMDLEMDKNETSTESSKQDSIEKFRVLHVEDECLLLSYEYWSTQTKCLMFSFDVKTIEKSTCHTKMPQYCRNNVKYLFGEEGPCKSPSIQRKERTSEEQGKLGQNKPSLKEPLRSISFDTVVSFLKNDGVIYLQMVSEEDRVHTDCKCIESALMAKSLNGSQRTVACFLDSDVLKENAEFEVVVKDEVTRVSANAIEGIAATQHPSTNILDSYAALEVETGCLLLSHGQSNDGKHKCTLWGLSKNVVSQSTKCYNQMKLLCTSNMYDLTKSNNLCNHFDLGEDSEEEE